MGGVTYIAMTLAGFAGYTAFIIGSVITFVACIAAIATVSSARLAFIIQPIISHFVTTITIMNAQHLDDIKQRAADDMADADGFADALDTGAAI